MYLHNRPIFTHPTRECWTKTYTKEASTGECTSEIRYGRMDIIFLSTEICIKFPQSRFIRRCWGVGRDCQRFLLWLSQSSNCGRVCRLLARSSHTRRIKFVCMYKLNLHTPKIKCADISHYFAGTIHQFTQAFRLQNYTSHEAEPSDRLNCSNPLKNT